MFLGGKLRIVCYRIDVAQRVWNMSLINLLLVAYYRYIINETYAEKEKYQESYDSGTGN